MPFTRYLSYLTTISSCKLNTNELYRSNGSKVPDRLSAEVKYSNCEQYVYINYSKSKYCPLLKNILKRKWCTDLTQAFIYMRTYNFLHVEDKRDD